MLEPSLLPNSIPDDIKLTPHQIAAAKRFLKVFRHGCQSIPTSGEGLLCGFHAIIQTMTYMRLPVAPPTVEELQEIYDSEEMKEMNASVLMDNDNNFTVDQVGATLFRWGESRGLNLQLGCVSTVTPIQLIPHPNDETTILVFIKHEDLGLIGHYSGLRGNEWDKPAAREPAEGENFEEPAFEENGSTDQAQNYDADGTYQTVDQEDCEMPDADADGSDHFEQDYWNQGRTNQPAYWDQYDELSEIEEIEGEYWNKQFWRL